MVLETGLIGYLTMYALHLLLLMPVGLFCGRDRISLNHASLQCAVLLVAVYVLRVFMKLGSFDIDDIILDLLGLCIGWFFGSMFTKAVRTN